jgi:hypothetical protein
VPDSTPRAACLATSRHRHRGLPPAPNDQSELACPPGRTPTIASSTTTVRAGATLSRRAASRNASGAGLPGRCSTSAVSPSTRVSNRLVMPASSSTAAQLRLLDTTAVSDRPRAARTQATDPERPRRPSAGVESGVPSRSAMSREARKSRTPLDAACRRRRRRSRSVRRTARCGPHAWRPMSGGIRRTGASRPPHAPSEWCQNAVEVVQHGIEVLRDDWRRHRDPFGQFKARARRSTPRPSAVMVRIGRGAST